MTEKSIEKKSVEIPVEQGTTEQKLTALVRYQHNQTEYLKQQTEHLKSIKGSLSFIVFIIIAGLIIQFLIAIFS